MINEKEALSLVRNHDREAILLGILDYDNKHWIIEVKYNGEEFNEREQLYGVDKNSGKITNFFPAANIEKFMNAIETRGFKRVEG